VLPRPHIRMPIWVAFALAAVAFVIRGVMKGFDFRPDMPMDAIVLAMLVAVVAMVAWTRANDTQPDRDLPAAHECDKETKDPES
jgi:hypothetical protein